MLPGSPEPSVSGLLPWHQAPWRLLQEMTRLRRLPHALLISGIRGLGKRRLAEQLAQALFCEARGPEGLACGSCDGCHLFRTGNHPDYLVLQPDPSAKSDEIKIDSVRELIEGSALTAHTAAHKITIIEPAENMNAAAANSLLKTLEEPVPGTLLILVTAQPMRLPATIRSRCQPLPMRAPAETAALSWLQQQGIAAPQALLVLRLAGGAPLAALQLADPSLLDQRRDAFAGFVAVRRGTTDPVRTADAWTKLEPGLLLRWLAGWLQDIARLLSGHSVPPLANPDKLDELRQLAQTLEPAQVQSLLKEALQLRRLSATTVNRQMALEGFLIAWAAAPRP